MTETDHEDDVMRFSILSLLAMTGYVALVVAGITYPDSVWSFVAVAAWFLFVAFLIIAACDSASIGSKAGRVVLLTTILYMIMATQFAAQKYTLPHEWLSRWLLKLHVPAELKAVGDPSAEFLVGNVRIEYVDPNFVNRDGLMDDMVNGKPSYYLGVPQSRIEQLALYNTSLLFGMISGGAAHWRYRRSERRG